MDEIIQQLKTLKTVTADKKWVDRNKELLLTQIKSQTKKQEKINFVAKFLLAAKSIVPNSFGAFVVKPVGIVSLILTVVLGSGLFSVSASKGSLPGDVLYPVKLSKEKLQVGLTLSPAKKAELNIKFTEERVKEIKEITNEEVVDSKMVEEAVFNLEEQILETKETLDKVKEKKGEAVSNLIVNIDKKTKELSENLVVVTEQIKDEGTIKSIKQANLAIEDLADKAVEVIIEKQEQGEIELTDAELVEKLTDRLEKIEQDSQEINNIIKESENIEEIIIEKQENEEALSEENEGVIIDSEVQEVSISSQIKQTEEKVEEAKELLSQGDLDATLEKIQEIKDLNKETEETVNAVEVIIE